MNTDEQKLINYFKTLKAISERVKGIIGQYVREAEILGEKFNKIISAISFTKSEERDILFYGIGLVHKIYNKKNNGV